MAQDAITFLKQQHREVEDLFSELEATTERATKTRSQLVQKIATALEAHAQIEEKAFYPEGREVDEDMTLEAFEEHNVIRYEIDRLKQTETTDESFMARVTVLKELVQHHVKEEEHDYFPQVKKELGKARLEELGAELEKLHKQTLKNLQSGADEKSAVAAKTRRPAQQEVPAEH